MMTDAKTVSGKKVVVGFASSMGVLALVGLAVVIWVRAQPVVQSDQRSMARLLSNAYQKYRYDVRSWPTDAYDAAMNFKSENPDLAARVKKAQSEWGLHAEMRDVTSESPSVKFVFDKPSKLEMTFTLYNRDRRPR